MYTISKRNFDYINSFNISIDFQVFSDGIQNPSLENRKRVELLSRLDAFVVATRIIFESISKSNICFQDLHVLMNELCLFYSFKDYEQE